MLARTAGRTLDTNWCSQTSYTHRCFCWSCAWMALLPGLRQTAAALGKWLLSKGGLPGLGVLGIRKIPKARSHLHWSTLWNTVIGILRRGLMYHFPSEDVLQRDLYTPPLCQGGKIKELPSHYPLSHALRKFIFSNQISPDRSYLPLI